MYNRSNMIDFDHDLSLEDFGGLDAEVTIATVKGMNIVRQQYFYANKNPEQFVSRAEARVAYDKAQLALNRALNSLRDLPITNKFNHEIRRLYRVNNCLDENDLLDDFIKLGEKIERSIGHMLEDDNLNKSRFIPKPKRKNHFPKLDYFIKRALFIYLQTGSRPTLRRRR